MVKEFDRFDICLQAFQYERQEYFNCQKRIVRFDKFFQIAIEHVHHPLLRKMVERICRERDRFWTEEILADENNLEAARLAIANAQDAQLPVHIFSTIQNNLMKQQQQQQQSTIDMINN
ncbi:hypothetical protein BLA29_013028, partial [Euroglyphus maynei]